MNSTPCAETLPGPLESNLLPWKWLAGAAGLTAAADFLFYRHEPGLSVGLFALLMAGCLLLFRGEFRCGAARGALLALLGIAAVRSAVELCFSNVAVLSALLLVLLGETAYGALRQSWVRWCEAALAMFKSMGRWSALCRAFWKSQTGFFRGAGWAMSAIFPALLMLMVFGILLSLGNVIFGHWLSEAWERILKEIVLPPVSRVFFWAAASTLALAFLHPSPAPPTRRIWVGRPPAPVPAETARMNFWRTAILLGAMNLLFLAANGIDAAYLWMNAELPKAVTCSQYVHAGVYNLIATVIVSAIVLAAVFHQPTEITRGRVIRGLALAWIAQNLFLVASVGLRLKLYVDAYQYSTLRVYVAFFLALVSAGFVLLTLKIVLEKGLAWLVMSNAIATFALFFTVQFLNVEGWVADLNVNRWIENPGRPLDVRYLAELGPPAWPALERAASDPRNLPETAQACQVLGEIRSRERLAAEREDWRSFQWKRDFFRQGLGIGGAPRPHGRGPFCCGEANTSPERRALHPALTDGACAEAGEPRRETR